MHTLILFPCTHAYWSDSHTGSTRGKSILIPGCNGHHLSSKLTASTPFAHSFSPLWERLTSSTTAFVLFHSLQYYSQNFNHAKFRWSQNGLTWRANSADAASFDSNQCLTHPMFTSLFPCTVEPLYCGHLGELLYREVSSFQG